MARTQAIKNYKNLVKGFVTEGNEFDEVDGAIRDGQNVEILRTGGVRRRRGLNKEATATADKDLPYTTGYGWASNVYHWNNVGGDSAVNFVVIQTGRYLYFYERGQSSVLLDNYIGYVALSYNTHATNSYNDEDVSFATINGALYVVGDAVNPTMIIYSGATLYSQSFYLTFRDFIGDPDDVFLDSTDSYYPINKSVNTLTGTFTYNEHVTGSSGANLYFIRYQAGVGGGYDLLYCYNVVTAPVDGETLTGASSGATCVYHLAGAAFETAYQTDAPYTPNAHGHNLYNAGWTEANMVSYAANNTSYKWPSTKQVMSAGKDSSGNFSATELDKIDFGTTPAPKGKLYADIRQPEYKTDDSSYNSDYATNYPACVGSFSGRMFFGGMDYRHFANWVFFTPILDLRPEEQVATAGGSQPVQAANCYQKNDPTAEYESALLATDGGVIIIPDMGSAKQFISLEKALIIVADNGVWAITGSTSDTGFTADAYSVDRISNIGCRAAKSIVVANKSVIFWADTGIYEVTPSDIPGKYITNNLTIDTIHEFFKTISADARQNAISYYDRFNQRIYWAYKTATTLSTAKHHDSELILDLKLKCFHPPTVLAQADGTDKDNDPYIIGYTQDELEPGLTGFPTLKTVNLRYAASHNYLFFGQYDDRTFTDWANYNSGGDYSSYIEFWPDHVGDPVRDKKPVYVFCYFLKTEDGFTDIGGGVLTPNHVSSCMMTGKYQWHITSTAGKWNGPKQVYRYNRPYVPVDAADTYDTGQSVLVTKTRMRGKGKALTLKFASETGKDFQLLGYAIPYTSVYTP